MRAEVEAAEGWEERGCDGCRSVYVTSPLPCISPYICIWRLLMVCYDAGVGCKATDIDVSPGVFAKLANIDQGRVLVQWAWLEDAPVTVPSS